MVFFLFSFSDLAHHRTCGAAGGHAGQVDGPGSSRNDENGLHLARADFSDEPVAVL